MNIAAKIGIITAGITLAGCGEPLSYDTVQKAEATCLAKGGQPVMVTNAFRRPVAMSCYIGNVLFDYGKY